MQHSLLGKKENRLRQDRFGGGYRIKCFHGERGYPMRHLIAGRTHMESINTCYEKKKILQSYQTYQLHEASPQY